MVQTPITGTYTEEDDMLTAQELRMIKWLGLGALLPWSVGTVALVRLDVRVLRSYLLSMPPANS